MQNRSNKMIGCISSLDCRSGGGQSGWVCGWQVMVVCDGAGAS